MANPAERAPEQPRDASKALHDFTTALGEGKYTVDPDTAKAAIEALAKHAISDKALVEKILSALQESSMQQATADASESSSQPESPVWDLYINPALHKEIAKLTPQERQKIDKLTGQFTRDIKSFVITATKPLGAPKAPPGVDHVSFPVKEDPDEDVKVLRQNLSKDLPPAIHESLIAGDLSEESSIAIIDYPGDPNKKLLVGKLATRGGEATLYPHDHRGGGQKFYMTVSSKSKILDFLRHDKDAGLFSHIYQNAAVELNPEALSYVDAPLTRRFSTEGQTSRSYNQLVVLDVPNMKINVMQIEHRQNIAPRSKECATADDFKKYASMYLRDVRPLEFLRWRQLPDIYRT